MQRRGQYGPVVLGVVGVRERQHGRLDDVPGLAHVHALLRDGQRAVGHLVQDAVEVVVTARRLADQLTRAHVQRRRVRHHQHVAACQTESTQGRARWQVRGLEVTTAAAAAVLNNCTVGAYLTNFCHRLS